MKASSRSTTPVVAVVVTALAVGAMGLFGPTCAQAQSSIPREETWVTNGPVRAIVRTADTIYIGGEFNYVARYTGSGVPINAATGQPVAAFPKVKGTILACVPDGADGWYIGGAFSRVGGVTRNYIAHILSNASVDNAWNPNANGRVCSLAVSGSTVYAGGDFTSIGGQSRNCIAALNAATGNATAWNPNAGEYDPYVYALAVSGSTVYVGGRFTTIGGQTRNGMAGLDAATGQVTAWNPNANSSVFALAVSSSTVYVGGAFTRIGGQMRRYFAEFDFRRLATAKHWRLY